MELTKKQARAKAKATRRELPPETRAKHSKAICAALGEIPELSTDIVIAGYSPLPDEVDITEFATKSLFLGRTYCLPRVVRKNTPLTMHKITGKPNELTTGYGGILQPSIDLPSIPLEKIAVALVPSVSIDSTGNRLGFGQGFYDITIANMQDSLLIAPIFSCLVVDSLPTEPHDRKVDIIVTEREILDLRK